MQHNHNKRPTLALLPILLGLYLNNASAAPAPPMPPAVPAPSLQLPPALPSMPLPPAVSFSRGISIAEFTRLVLEDILRKPFVLSPALISATQQVGVSVEKLSPAAAEAVLTRVLRDNGFELQPGTVYYVVPSAIKPNTTPDRDWLTCRPLNRPVSYFASALPSVFPDAVFSFDKAKSGSSPGSGDQAGLDLFFVQVAPGQKKELLRLISELDKPVPRVAVRSTIVEVNTDQRTGDGVKLAASVLGTKLGFSIGSSPTGNSLTFKNASLDFAVGSFHGDSRFKTFSSPVMLLNHAQTGRFQVGSKVPITTSTTTNATTTNSVQFQDVGTIVTIVPQVVGDTVTMTVSLELSDVSQVSTGTTSAPTILTRNLTGQASVESGSLALIGNLQSSRETANDNKFFGFKLNSDNATTKTELVLMLYAELIPLTSAPDNVRCK